MTAKPKVSILMPAYNAEKYIAEAIESILNQTFNDFEFIIIDDCSVDQTWQIITTYAGRDKRVVALRNNPRLKLAKTLNVGVGIAMGKYIARMDADDWSYPDRIEKQVHFMDKHPEIGVSGGTMQVCNDQLRVMKARKYHLSDKAIRKNIFYYSPFCHPLIICRADILKVAGIYNESLNDAEDYDLYFRIGNYSKFGNLSDQLIKYRRTNSSVSFKNAVRQEILTLYIRVKAVIEYNYEMTLIQKFYFIFQFISIFIIPAKLKIWLFNVIR